MRGISSEFLNGDIIIFGPIEGYVGSLSWVIVTMRGSTQYQCRLHISVEDEIIINKYVSATVPVIC